MLGVEGTLGQSLYQHSPNRNIGVVILCSHITELYLHSFILLLPWLQMHQLTILPFTY